MNTWASIMLWEGADPRADRLVRENAQERLTIVFVPSIEHAAAVAAELVDDGTELIELCGGFGGRGRGRLERRRRPLRHRRRGVRHRVDHAGSGL